MISLAVFSHVLFGILAILMLKEEGKTENQKRKEKYEIISVFLMFAVVILNVCIAALGLSGSC